MNPAHAWMAAMMAIVANSCVSAPRVAEPLGELRVLVDLLEEKHVEPPPRERLVAAARDAMWASVDPYSSYLDADTYAELQIALSSRLGGVGLRVEPDGARFRVRGPLLGSPALRAGLRPGDLLFSVDGRPVEGQPLTTVLSWLRGEAGTSVDVVLARAASSEPVRARLTREPIALASVRGVRRRGGAWDHQAPGNASVAYLRIAIFSQTTEQEVARALEAIERLEPRGLVLDLRHNQGGLLSAAVAVADLFLPEGRIVTERGRGGATKHFEATAGVATTRPLAVLVDEATVSAAEVLAAALQDNRRAVVVGARSFGKGTVQQIFPLGPGAGAYRLTVEHYLRPSGLSIERHWPGAAAERGGVVPDEGLAVSATDGDALANALEDADADASVALDDTELPSIADPALAAACAALLARPASVAR